MSCARFYVYASTSALALATTRVDPQSANQLSEWFNQAMLGEQYGNKIEESFFDQFGKSGR